MAKKEYIRVYMDLNALVNRINNRTELNMPVGYGYGDNEENYSAFIGTSKENGMPSTLRDKKGVVRHCVNLVKNTKDHAASVPSEEDAQAQLAQVDLSGIEGIDTDDSVPI